jgi:cold shock CspA family protein
VDDKRDSRLMYVKEASTLNEGQNVSFNIVSQAQDKAS